MTKIVMIVRGPLGVTVSPGVEVVQNPEPEAVSQAQDSPATISEETLMVQEPGGLSMISLKALKDRVKEG